MDVNNSGKDGDDTQAIVILDAPSILDVSKLPTEENNKKKRRRGKTKRKILKPFLKIPWQERRMHDNCKRNNRFRKIIPSKTQAPFNNNQFLMEIHKPEPENNFHLFRTPSARTRESSFSVDSEENYFFSLPDDEEEYLTKEFSSVYEDAQTERLSNMSKNELIQEYLLLEVKYDNLLKRTDRIKSKDTDGETIYTDKDASITDKESMITDKDTSATSNASESIDDPSISDIMQRLKDQEEQIRQLQLANEKLVLENNHLHQRGQGSSEDSESDSSSSSDSCSSTSSGTSPVRVAGAVNGDVIICDDSPQVNGEHNHVNSNETSHHLVNGFHSPSD